MSDNGQEDQYVAWCATRMEALALLHKVFDPVCESCSVATITVGPGMAKKLMQALPYADEVWDGPPMFPIKLDVNWHMPDGYICYRDSSGRVLRVVHYEERSEEGAGHHESLQEDR